LKHKREIGQLLPQTHSPELDYSLFMSVMMVLTSERVEKRSGATPAAFPTPIFAGIASVSVFGVSPLPLIAIVQGVYI
jgi:energy-converting hydrogenase Eha subunit A